jgi:hypothetical protein
VAFDHHADDPLLAGRDWLVMGWRALRLPAAA